MNNGPKTQRPIRAADPREILWLHQTISPSFAQGAPAPTPSDPLRKLPGERVAKVANDIKMDPKIAQKFPPLQVFELTDPDTEEKYTYSLSNRRLTAFRSAGITDVNVQNAEFSQIAHSFWKMTSIDGGFTQPQQTSIASNKTSEPNEQSTLGKFKRHMSRLSYQYENYCRTNGIVGDEKDTYITSRLEEQAKLRFKLK
ncbi:hypothetical protein [Candidatus Berkiella aquae]|uniref:Uncharacterized protein n=1 Tax=Candidatus Berkiella aquae TaxID=295108 RepID=A0A0Q9Z099_9GAMM|nr:hypothetical protein [Candidatus Berkiella aquae]MCS5711930.1 hypothetical protein [Candidatus Berkiella aquae]